MPGKAEAIILLLVSVFLVSSCTRNDSVSKSSNALIRIGINRSVKSSPIVIAEKSGFFLEKKIKTELLIEPSAIKMMDNLEEKKCDIVCVPEYQFVNNTHGSSIDFRIIAVLNRNQSRSLVMNNDILSSPSELAGTRIGLAANSAGEYTLYRLLVFNNIEYGSVDIVYKKPQELASALASGEVDSVIVWSPFTYEAAEKLGKKASVINAQLGRDMYWLLVSEKQWAEENTEKIISFLESIEKSYKIINDDPEDAQNITAEYLSLDLESIKNEWREYIFYLELPQSLILAMEQEAEWIYKQFSDTEEIPDFSSLIDYRYLESLYPERVTIIR